ncbi:uncharacterized protein LOC115877738 [Sitophilus oryzae]|uniref:Uncharacterized protein LOC115877738 n=1 Tax=Sitophilus oryzae TaxID=7048 RepID=A0A6J2XF48_SITOR|nr:uncharacterized protein LOC115877738 [Sitophilus oryzae]
MNKAKGPEILNNCGTCDQLKKDFDEESNDEGSCSTDSEEETSSSCTNNSIIELSLGRLSSQTSRSTFRRSVLPNKSFSSEKVRDIERRNAILVEKILYHNRRPNQYKTYASQPVKKATSSEINRRRHQEKISRENEILLKKSSP